MLNYPVNYKYRLKQEGDGAFNCLVMILLAIIIAVVSFNLLFSKIYIVGNSMGGTFTGAAGSNMPGGDYVYIMKNVEPLKGDIVVIDTAYLGKASNEKILIKRLIARENDTVELVKGTLYINGVVVDEPYILPQNNNPELLKNSFSKLKGPEGHVFCMGDNRNDSVDSRSYYGFIPASSIMGVVSDWSIRYLNVITAFNTFIEFTLPGKLGIK